MKKITQPGRGRLLCSLLAGSLMVPPAMASEEMPEVLRYAREYRQVNPVGPEAAPRAADSGAGLARQLARSELIRRQQQAQLQVLEKKVQALAAQKPAGQTEPAAAALRQANDALKAQVGAAGQDVQAARNAQRQAEAARQVQALEVADLQQKNTALLAAQQKADAALKAGETALARERTTVTAVRLQADTLAAEKAALETRVQTLLQKPAPETERVVLKTPRQQQAYAAGVMYARDVREAQKGNRLLGVELDAAVLLAGLTDALQDRPFRLETKALEAATRALEKAAGDGYTRVTKAQAIQAETWLKTFRKEKGTEKDDAGFWYRVTYEGDGERLTAEDTVDVVVEESLTDGTVVSDMDRAGSSLRQKVAEFPPVFTAGLLRLRNHGQITLMVPPALAYGDKGYPPDVPPGATMIYRIRVADRVLPGAPDAQKPQKTPHNVKPDRRQAG